MRARILLDWVLEQCTVSLVQRIIADAVLCRLSEEVVVHDLQSATLLLTT
jgi:hypothetical protein